MWAELIRENNKLCQVFVDAVLEEDLEEYYVLRSALLGRIFYPKYL